MEGQPEIGDEVKEKYESYLEKYRDSGKGLLKRDLDLVLGLMNIPQTVLDMSRDPEKRAEANREYREYAVKSDIMLAVQYELAGQAGERDNMLMTAQERMDS
ncbi:MAG: hypothetical protein KJ709_08455 [Nanoarchaeota archaeon]|nr:hypothetical protein [Nanoarchaeota archaeon]